MTLAAIRTFVHEHPDATTYAAYGTAVLGYYAAWKLYPISTRLLTGLGLVYLYHCFSSSGQNNLSRRVTSPSKPNEAPLKDPISQEIIPKDFLVFLGKTAFDARSLFLSLVNSPGCLNPVTNLPPSDQDLQPLLNLFQLSIKEFRDIWRFADDKATKKIQEDISSLSWHFWQPYEEIQLQYFREHDEELRNYKRTCRQQYALGLVGFRAPILAAKISEQLG